MIRFWISWLTAMSASVWLMSRFFSFAAMSSVSSL